MKKKTIFFLLLFLLCIAALFGCGRAEVTLPEGATTIEGTYISDEMPVGYCYVSAFKGRAAYDWSVETSIYVKEDCRKSGIGRALYQTLEEVLSLQHVCNLCACIAYPNPPSIRFHEAFGYETVAHFHKSGFKSGQWYDMVWLEKTLTKHEIPPLPFRPYPEISDTYWSR